jgi:hypothetical protein
LKEDYQERQAKVVQQATQHMYEKLHDLAEHAKERLSDPKKSFHGTLTENIKEFAELVPELNINKDAFLEQAARELRIAIGDKDIDSLRKDEQVRATAAQDATTILDKVKKQMEAFHAKT